MSTFMKPSFYKNVRKPLSNAKTLNPLTYFSKTFYKAEQKQVFNDGWSCVGITQQTRGHGETFRSFLGDKHIFITRNRENELQGFFNTCRHRAHPVVTKDGTYPTIMCPYHKWTYNLNGKLVKTPMFFDEAKNCEKKFCKKSNSLFGLRLETIGNMVFATNNKQIPPLNTLMGDLGKTLEPYNLQNLVVWKQKEYKVKCNWKLLQENFMEYLHLPSIHPALNEVSKPSNHHRFQGPGQYIGFITKPITGDNSPVNLPSIEGLPYGFQDVALFNQLFPNVFYFLLPSHIYMIISFPVNETETIERAYLLGPKEKEEEVVEPLWDFYDMTNIEDIDACEQINYGIRCSEYTGGPLSPKYEETIHRFQNIFASYMVGEPYNVPKGDGCIKNDYRQIEAY